MQRSIVVSEIWLLEIPFSDFDRPWKISSGAPPKVRFFQTWKWDLESEKSCDSDIFSEWSPNEYITLVEWQLVSSSHFRDMTFSILKNRDFGIWKGENSWAMKIRKINFKKSYLRNNNRSRHNFYFLSNTYSRCYLHTKNCVEIYCCFWDMTSWTFFGFEKSHKVKISKKSSNFQNLEKIWKFCRIFFPSQNRVKHTLECLEPHLGQNKS